MKPRTKLERQLVEWSAKLPPLTEAQRKYAYGLFAKVGYYWKGSGKVWCQCCGHVEHKQLSELSVSLELFDTCPKCGAHLHLRHWKEGQKSYGEGKYFSIVRPYRGWMVVRTFDVCRHNKLGEPTRYEANEVYQNWISPEGREVIVGRRYSRSPFHMQWDYGSPMDVKHHNQHAAGYYAMEDVFDVSGNYYYPRATVTPILRRNGWNAKILDLRISVPDTIAQLLTIPEAETVAKQGQWDVFAYLVKCGGFRGPVRVAEYRHALNICHRHGYYIHDASMWFDYLELLNYFQLDTHNPKYVCPAHLIAEHDRLVKRKDKLEAERKVEARMREIALEEPKYRRMKGRFLGICITDGKLEVRPIPTVKDFYEEGQAMHHCVYSNNYYKREDCLILSARIDGQRIETVEVSLKTFQVVQSRGVCNKNTEYHNRIVELVRENMNKIKQAI